MYLPIVYIVCKYMKVNKQCDTFSVPYFSYFFRPHHSQSVLAIPA